MTTDAMTAKRGRPDAPGWVPHAVMIPLVAVSVLPIWWMIVTSLRPENAIFETSPFPADPTLANYAYALGAAPVGAMLLNTAIFSVAATAAQLLTAVFAAYAFACWRFPFDRVLYALVALTWLVPFQVVMIPNYVLLSRWGLVDTLTGLVLPNAASAFAVMLLVQSMRAFPVEIIEAARLDGAGHWRVLTRLILPNLRAPLAALTILLFISAWNEYFWPLLLTRSEASQVIQIGIQSFLTEEGNQWGPLMALSTLACLPVLAIYAVLQRQVIDSFVKAGLR